MALNIKDPRTERLAEEVASLAHESKTHAIRTALAERKVRLEAETRKRRRGERLDAFLQEEAWPQVPAHVIGQPIPRAEREAILGYGPEGM